MCLCDKLENMSNKLENMWNKWKGLSVKGKITSLIFLSLALNYSIGTAYSVRKSYLEENQVMVNIDTNNNGLVEPEEALTAYRELGYDNEKSIEEMKYGTNFLRAQLKERLNLDNETLNNVFKDLSPKTVRMLVAGCLDLNQDGYVERQEIEEAYMIEYKNGVTSPLSSIKTKGGIDILEKFVRLYVAPYTLTNNSEIEKYLNVKRASQK